ncbi:MAG: 2-oxo-4-hydroxy-4-carboxy-5-ureidoimidazoline decarboxylase [Streptomyces sp.]|nr:2-oxo-4-hydroxy-4-carboxy-5-ureidoimidazoline decarboxylase [Streptomyces sp.]NUS17825.1 2-oxo-4-hydroxy-4-carboxy-5-ureidoimidazoline decarboxylase [Streptomyces sp.]
MLPSDHASAAAPPSPLTRFNQAPIAAAEAALLACCGSHRWARRMAAHRPYPTVEALLAAADEAAYDLTSGDLAEALAGEAPVALTDRGGLVVHTALRAAHAHYEARFGHSFILALDERAAADPAAALDETLVSLRERLGHDADEESVVTAEQLRKLCRARLLRAFEPSRSPDRAGSITPGLPRRTQAGSRRYDGRGRWTVPGRA